MKYKYLLAWCLFILFSAGLYAQESEALNQPKIQLFKTELSRLMQNGMLHKYLQRHAGEITIDTLTETSPYIDSMRATPAGSVTGPYVYESTRMVFFILQLSKDSIYKEEAEAAHILFYVPSKATDKEREAKRQQWIKTYNAIKASSDPCQAFVKYARNGDDGTRENDGNLGYFSKGMMVKEFEDACFNAQEGDILKVETEYGYHIVWLKDKRAGYEKIVPVIYFAVPEWYLLQD